MKHIKKFNAAYSAALKDMSYQQRRYLALNSYFMGLN